MPVTIPARDLKDTSKVCKLCRESNEPVMVTKNGYEEVVLVKPADFYKMDRALRKQELYDSIAHADAQIDRSDGVVRVVRLFHAAHRRVERY